jgi:hypothetical protein
MPDPLAVATLCQDAAEELNLVMVGEALDANDAFVILRKLNTLIDLWNAQREAIYATQAREFTLVPGLAPHTIGPAGATFTVSQRPVAIDGASFIYETGSTPVYTPILVRDMPWWDAQPIPGLATSVQTDVAYNPTVPLGELYFWPVPTTQARVSLFMRAVLAEVTLTDHVTLPPGYRAAVTLTLAEDIATAFGRDVPAKTEQRAREARAVIFANNDLTPPYATVDAGMPGHQAVRASTRNWQTGWYS